MRKDVECAFGILKGRFRILKAGVRLHSIRSVDMVWLTCCALHNMLLEVDGLDEPWDGSKVPTSEWEGALGELEEEDVPVAMRRALCPAEIRQYDTSTIGHADQMEGCTDGEDCDAGIIGAAEVADDPDVVRNVNDLSQAFSATAW